MCFNKSSTFVYLVKRKEWSSFVRRIWKPSTVVWLTSRRRKITIKKKLLIWLYMDFLLLAAASTALWRCHAVCANSPGLYTEWLRGSLAAFPFKASGQKLTRPFRFRVLLLQSDELLDFGCRPLIFIFFYFISFFLLATSFSRLYFDVFLSLNNSLSIFQTSWRPFNNVGYAKGNMKPLEKTLMETIRFVLDRLTNEQERSHILLQSIADLQRKVTI